MSYALNHTFIASDHHFGSLFNNKEKEDEWIYKWNSIVDPSDVVIYNGDFCDSIVVDLCEYAKKLNGAITLVKGNHDHLPDSIYQAIFSNVVDEMYMPELNLVIHHIPTKTTFNQIYGHLHRGEIIGPLDKAHNFCSCVQANDGYPISLEHILLSFK